MAEISSDELYYGLLAYGLFSEKLPPIFTSEVFYEYCCNLKQPFNNQGHQYIHFESIRNVNNIPRAYGIPNPMAYQKLCKGLADYWDKLQRHFQNQTQEQAHIVSRIHIRKHKGSKALFEMNYKNWKTDGTPELDLFIGKKYIVEADIATCFPSIYTHSLCWALVGKNVAKINRNDSEWYNQIDKWCRNLKDGETHGLMIGPHTSNLLSEIVLTTIDKNLTDKNWAFTRNIDDYSCYVSSYEEGQKFLIDLGEELRKFDLSLNQKKTAIKELPLPVRERWVHVLNMINKIFLVGEKEYKKINYEKIQSYMDEAIQLVKQNDNNAAVLKYAMKVIAQKELSENARTYCVKLFMHLAIIYPYLVLYLDEYVFQTFNVDKKDIETFSNLLYSAASNVKNYEAMYYTIYFALKYDFLLTSLKVEDVIANDSCLLKLFAYLYCKKNNDKDAKKLLKEHAKHLADIDFDKFWIFIYECLSENELKDEWKKMKEKKVTFLRAIY